VGKVRGTYQVDLFSDGNLVSVFCDGANYVLVSKFDLTVSGGLCSSSPLEPVGTGCLGDVSVGTKVCKFTDSQLNSLVWEAWKIVQDDRADGPGDPQRIITNQAGQFDVSYCSNYNQVSGTTNGHNQEWCYKNTPSAGTRCGDVQSTNTYGPSPHEAGQGGFWIHSESNGGGGFSCGFGSAAESSCTETSGYAVHMYACVGCTADQI